MAQLSAIEWTDATWNPVVGCSKVSPGCAHCYAETLSRRFGWTPHEWTPEHAAENVILKPERLEQPLRWREPRMVFVNSMSDLFHELVPEEYIREVFLRMAACPEHIFQVLTKRPERAREVLAWIDEQDQRHEANYFSRWPVRNVWLGVSIENARYTWRADVLREIPAAVRFISAEPLLGSLIEGGRGDSQGAREIVYEHYGFDAGIARDLNVNCGRAPLDLAGIDWLIVGGESGGRQARPMHPEWARELRDACIAQRIHGAFEHHREPGQTALFFKQWGSWVPYEPDVQQPYWSGQDGGMIDGHELPVGLAEHVPRSRSAGSRVWLWPDPEEEPIYCYAGASPKSGGRELDGRTWDEMPAREAALA